MEASADYQYAPLRIPPDTSRAAAATMLSLQADTGGWELARLQLHAHGPRKVILRPRPRLSPPPLPRRPPRPAAARPLPAGASGRAARSSTSGAILRCSGPTTAQTR